MDHSTRSYDVEVRTPKGWHLYDAGYTLFSRAERAYKEAIQELRIGWGLGPENVRVVKITREVVLGGDSE